MKKKIAIVGGGASGVFCAIQIAINSHCEVHIFEKTDELLKKVKISGGGRCNVTHEDSSPSQFVKSYPRGSQLIKKNISVFAPKDMMKWLNDRGVPLKIEEDGRVFPISNNSQTIIVCFLAELNKRHVQVHFNSNLEDITIENQSVFLTINQKKETWDAVVIATGGATNNSYLDLYTKVGLKTIRTVPSLFTFKTTEKAITELMGISLPNAQIKIVGTKLIEKGSLLITHWGFSGPAILRLSAWGAFELAQNQYDFTISINWDASFNEESMRTKMTEIRNLHPKSLVSNKKIETIPNRLWTYFLIKSEIHPETKWGDVSKKQFNKLLNALIHSEYSIKGKTTFKEEFVTAGGIDLESLDPHTMSLKTNPNIYFIGEITNVDGITGGYNFQNAWTSAFIAAKSISSK